MSCNVLCLFMESLYNLISIWIWTINWLRVEFEHLYQLHQMIVAILLALDLDIMQFFLYPFSLFMLFRQVKWMKNFIEMKNKLNNDFPPKGINFKWFKFMIGEISGELDKFISLFLNTFLYINWLFYFVNFCWWSVNLNDRLLKLL